jgi:hypothetical protein
MFKKEGVSIIEGLSGSLKGKAQGRDKVEGKTKVFK